MIFPRQVFGHRFNCGPFFVLSGFVACRAFEFSVVFDQLEARVLVMVELHRILPGFAFVASVAVFCCPLALKRMDIVLFMT